MTTPAPPMPPQMPPPDPTPDATPDPTPDITVAELADQAGEAQGGGGLAAAEAWMLDPLRASTLPTHGPGREILRRQGTPVGSLTFPTITVVGSKGKGTATIAASATLANAGLRVGTVTSPSLVSARERVRIDGQPVSVEDYLRVVTGLRSTYDALRCEHPDWRLPGLGGRSLLAGMRVFTDAAVEVGVLEASMGGATDLTHIFGSKVVVITGVFAEHLGALGNTLEEIAVEKLGAITERTEVVVTLRQSPQVAEAWENSGLLNTVRVVVIDDAPHGHHPHPFTDQNIELGRVAAAEWIHLYRPDLLGPDGDGQPSPAPTMRLPGRCQLVANNGMVDCAISAPGVEAALAEYHRSYDRDPKTLYVSLPRSKDDTGVFALLEGLDTATDVVAVDLPDLMDHLRPDPHLWPALVDIADLDFTDEQDYLALGTVSFAARTLTKIAEDTGPLW